VRPFYDDKTVFRDALDTIHVPSGLSPFLATHVINVIHIWLSKSKAIENQLVESKKIYEFINAPTC